MRALVIGCGVSGLSSAIRMQESGHDVTIWGRELPPHTTSDIAAAIWYPYRAYPQDRVLVWSRRSFAVFEELAAEPDAGVAILQAVEVVQAGGPDPGWRGSVRRFRRACRDELPEGADDGFVFEVPRVEMPKYLRYLRARFEAQGGAIVQREVRALDEALAECTIVVNCAGLGARELVGDRELYAIRGQIVRVSAPSVQGVCLDDRDPLAPTYVVPRGGDCILGGTSEEHEDSLTPDPGIAAGILNRCARLSPQTQGAPVLQHLVGLRPGRREVRLEAEVPAPGQLVVHNYGHGGAGVTVSWGCAEEVVALVSAVPRVGPDPRAL